MFDLGFNSQYLQRPDYMQIIIHGIEIAILLSKNRIFVPCYRIISKLNYRFSG